MNTKTLLTLGIIIFLAFVLRFYQLGSVPNGLDWDEASLGWNAYSLLKTGTDEYGTHLPISIRSFNDYKPPAYVYSAIPSISLFGLNEFSTRLPSAVAGTLTVLLTFYLVLEFGKREGQKNRYKLALMSAFFLAISPWHIQFSRVAFETNLCLFFFVCGATALVTYLNSKNLRHLLWAAIAFMAAIYSYHSARLVVPIFLTGMAIYYFRFLLSQFKQIFVAILLLVMLAFPLIRNTLHVGSLQARFDSVSIFENGKPLYEYPAIIADNYLSHFSFDFLFLSGDGNERHHSPGVGLLYLVEAPLLFAGLYFLVRNRPKWWFLIFWWILSAPTAAALTRDVPHAVRSLLFLPMYQILISYGLLELWKKSNLNKTLILTLFLGFVVNIYYFLNAYFIQLPFEFAKSWQFGYKQMVGQVLKYEGNYNHVYITTEYDQPYIYFLYYGRISPIIKNNGYFAQSMDKYVFKNYTSLSGEEKKLISGRDLLILGSKEETKGLLILKQFKFPDGSLAFTIGRKI